MISGPHGFASDKRLITAPNEAHRGKDKAMQKQPRILEEAGYLAIADGVGGDKAASALAIAAQAAGFRISVTSTYGASGAFSIYTDSDVTFADMTKVLKSAKDEVKGDFHIAVAGQIPEARDHSFALDHPIGNAIRAKAIVTSR